MVAFMTDLAKENNSTVSLFRVGKSYEQRTIYGVKVSYRIPKIFAGPKYFQLSTSSSYKPAIFIDAGVHAREWIAPASALWMIKEVP